ncbi:MAG TPA: alpha/beta hydrolase [Hyalangium sp.]|nr:alpha/beta hydrolase [Hyalangium sp.]
MTLSTISVEGARAWAAAGRHMDVRGHRIFVRTGGSESAPPLLLLHGFPTSSLDWAPVWNELAREHRLIAFDFLGFGFSDKPRHHVYDLMEQASIAEAVAAAHGAPAPHLLAHDYGVSVAQELLARAREGGPLAVRSCCFLNGGLIPESHRARFIQRLLASPLGVLVAMLISQKRFAESFSAVFAPATRPSQAELDGYWAAMTHQNGHRLGHKQIRYMEDRRKHRARWVGVLEHPLVPIALINGSVDPVSGVHLADAVATLNPLIPITRLDDVGHYPQVEAPERVLEAYRMFRASLVAPR